MPIAGLVALADDGPHGPLRRASLTEDGRVRYGVLLQRHDAHIARAEPDVPCPVLDVNVEPLDSGERDSAAIQTPADRRLSAPAQLPAPGDRPGTTPATGPTLHWARDPCDGHLHQSSVLVCSPETAR